MAEIPEKIDDLDHLVMWLEEFKAGGFNSLGTRTPLEGYNTAIRLVRTFQKAFFSDRLSRLLQAFEEYASSQKHHRVLDSIQCSECGNIHHQVLSLRMKVDGVTRYWFICETLLQPSYFFPEE